MNRDNKETMPKKEFRAIRERLNLTRDAYAIELGYEGNENGNRKSMHRFESGRRGIPLTLAKLAWMLDKHGLPDWPEYLEAKPAQADIVAESGQEAVDDRAE